MIAINLWIEVPSTSMIPWMTLTSPRKGWRCCHINSSFPRVFQTFGWGVSILVMILLLNPDKFDQQVVGLIDIGMQVVQQKKASARWSFCPFPRCKASGVEKLQGCLFFVEFVCLDLRYALDLPPHPGLQWQIMVWVGIPDPKTVFFSGGDWYQVGTVHPSYA